MKHYDSVFFCDEAPVATVIYNKDNTNWPFTIRLTTTGYYYEHPSVTLYLKSEADFIKFKNSVIRSYEVYWRNRNVS